MSIVSVLSKPFGKLLRSMSTGTYMQERCNHSKQLAALAGDKTLDSWLVLATPTFPVGLGTCYYFRWRSTTGLHVPVRDLKMALLIMLMTISISCSGNLYAIVQLSLN